MQTADARTVAAITAAIAAFEDVSPADVRVAAVAVGAGGGGAAAAAKPGGVPVGWPPVWALAGRQAQMQARTAHLAGRGKGRHQ